MKYNKREMCILLSQQAEEPVTSPRDEFFVLFFKPRNANRVFVCRYLCQAPAETCPPQ